MLVYSAGCNFFSVFSMRLFCFVQTNNCMLVWLYIFLGCTRACVDVMVMSSA